MEMGKFVLAIEGELERQIEEGVEELHARKSLSVVRGEGGRRTEMKKYVVVVLMR
jgi:hypothetical protein